MIAITLRNSILHYGIAALAIVLAGCTTIRQPLHVDDENVRDVAGSVVIRPESMHYHGRHGEGGIEFAYERHRGRGVQAIQAPHYVSVGGQTINGTQTIVNEADSEYGHVAYDHLMHLGRYFEFEPSLGLAFSKVTVNTQASNPPTAPGLSLSERNWGLNITLTPRWNFNDYVGMEARVRYSVFRDASDSQTFIPSVVLRPIANVAIHAGYMWFSQRVETPDNSSNVEIRFQGPSIALRLAF